MAQKKQRLWVELEVSAMRTRAATPPLRPVRFAYAIVNPRTRSTIERSLFQYKAAAEAIKAGVAYLRATYNTGRPQGRR